MTAYPSEARESAQYTPSKLSLTHCSEESRMFSGTPDRGLTSFSFPISNLAPWSCSRTMPGTLFSGEAESGTRRYERSLSPVPTASPCTPAPGSPALYSTRRQRYPSLCSPSTISTSSGPPSATGNADADHENAAINTSGNIFPDNIMTSIFSRPGRKCRLQNYEKEEWQ